MLRKPECVAIIRSLCVAGVFVMPLSLFAAPSPRPIHAFSDVPDGKNPRQQLAANAQGHLFLTTEQGGANNLGAVIEIIPPSTGKIGWTERVIHSFSINDGFYPTCRIFIDGTGALFGTTSQGGAQVSGILWKVTYDAPSDTWSYSVPFVFGSCFGSKCPGQVHPASGVVQDSYGRLFGVGQNSVYMLTPQPPNPYNEYQGTLLHQFAGATDGSAPVGELALNAHGDVFGVTSNGGSANDGIAYRLERPQNTQNRWDEAILWNFNSAVDGWWPDSGLVLGAGGILYGTTTQGPGPNRFNGTIFELVPPQQGNGAWNETIIGIPDGLFTHGPLAFDHNGAAYAVTTEAASDDGSYTSGSIYRISPPSSAGQPWLGDTVTTTFTQRTGFSPSAGLLLLKGRLYGPAAAGGYPNTNAGTVYAYHP